MATIAPSQRKAIRLVKVIETITHYIALLTIASMLALPLVWMVSTSLKPRKEVFRFPPQFIPPNVQWENDKDAWEAQPFDRFMFNSFKVSILSIFGQSFFCSLAGYGFARFDFPFKDQLFAMLLAAVLATFTFIGTWNSFFEPLVFLQSTEQFTVTIGLATFRQEEGTIWNLLMAASVISLLPSLIVFIFTQRYFVRGIVTTGLK